MSVTVTLPLEVLVNKDSEVFVNFTNFGLHVSHRYNTQVMHRCLLVPEIVRTVCDKVNECWSSSNCMYDAKSDCDHCAKASFAALARTCQMFREPALDHLWSSLRSLKPLLKVMPPDLWEITVLDDEDEDEEENEEEAEETFSLRRQILPSDWTRFFVYASRVKKFSIYNSVYSAEIDGGYSALHMAAGRRVLLPNLRELILQDDVDDLFAFIDLFLAPKLTFISIMLDDCPVRLSILTTLNFLYPSLPRLKLKHKGSDSEALARSVAPNICLWNNLETLSIPSLSPEALCHVAALPTLLRLSLTDVEGSYPSGLPPRDVPAFRSLTCLKVQCGNLSYCTGLITSMADAKLVELRLCAREPESSLVWMLFLQALENHCNHSSLTKIIVTTDDYGSYDGDDLHEFCPLTRHLDPMFAFRNLTRAAFSLVGHFDLTDADVKKMAMSWPNVEYLTLYTSSEPMQHPPHATLHSLVSLAEYCPKLDFVRLSFNATIIPPLPSYSKICNKSLSHIEPAGYYPDIQPIPVARFLLGIFPNLLYIDLDPSNLNDVRKWREVKELILSDADRRSG